MAWHKYQCDWINDFMSTIDLVIITSIILYWSHFDIIISIMTFKIIKEISWFSISNYFISIAKRVIFQVLQINSLLVTTSKTITKDDHSKMFFFNWLELFIKHVFPWQHQWRWARLDFLSIFVFGCINKQAKYCWIWNNMIFMTKNIDGNNNMWIQTLCNIDSKYTWCNFHILLYRKTSSEIIHLLSG
jgi:hypothetical protein